MNAIDWLAWLQQGGVVIAWVAVWTLCLLGLAISCLSLSGTWLVSLATVIAVWLRPDEFPGWGLVAVFLVLSGLIELAEWAAGAWGVKKRGGSGWAGFATIVGGVVGMFPGALIPVPVLGSMIGMFVGSFVGAFAVEWARLKHKGQAANIAWGTVVARVLVILLKVVTTLGMTIALVVGMVVD